MKLLELLPGCIHDQKEYTNSTLEQPKQYSNQAFIQEVLPMSVFEQRLISECCKTQADTDPIKINLGWGAV